MPKEPYERFLKELERKRAPGVARAIELLAQSRFDEAERAIHSLDDSIYGCVAIARLYRERLQELVRQGEVERNKAHVEAVFRKALFWAQSCYPEPHTAMEAEQYAQGRADDLAQLTAMLGYTPERLR